MIWRPTPDQKDWQRSSKSFGRHSDAARRQASIGSSKDGGFENGSHDGSAPVQGPRQGSQGVFVVLHGIVRSAYAAPDGTQSVSLENSRLWTWFCHHPEVDRQTERTVVYCHPSVGCRLSTMPHAM